MRIEQISSLVSAYVIPAVRRILDDRKRNTFLKGPKVLILVPTRELAIQVSQHVKALSANVIPKINHVTIVGGLTAHKQKRVLMKKNPEIIIATPGRLWQLMGEDDIRHLRSLSQIKSLILDEADRLCEAGHFKVNFQGFKFKKFRFIFFYVLFCFKKHWTEVVSVPAFTCIYRNIQSR